MVAKISIRKPDDREFGIVVPKYDNSQRKIKVDLIKKVATEMSKHFGGATILPTVLGAWVDDNGNLQVEENVLITSMRDVESPEDIEKVKEDEQFMKKLAQMVGDEFGQAYVMITDDIKEVDFVEGRYKEELPKSKVGIDFFSKLI